tara:strand:- start:55 stop:1329 length:1275 start_codon:yes stop_codon:yes gene_type:complete
MSGTIVNNVARASGTIAATPGGLDWSTAVVTGSTVTVEAGRGYFINTTSNACTVTLPASPEVGDQIVLADYARTWATNAVTLDSNGNNFQGEADTFTVDYDTVGQSLNIVYADSTKGWLPVSDDAVAFDHGAPPTQKGIFAFGTTGSYTNISNLVSSSGVVASDVTGVGDNKIQLLGATYGGDKGIFGFGDAGGYSAITNLVNNSGVVASNVAGVGTARAHGASSGYGDDLAIYAFGTASSAKTAVSNKINNSGVVASDTSASGTAKNGCAGVRYGSTGQAVISFGANAAENYVNARNLISNTGVVASDASGAGTARQGLAATSYGGDKAIFAYGTDNSAVNMSNLVNNSGVVGADVTGVGTARFYPSATNYGGDKGLFAFGNTGSSRVNTRNLVNNSGVIAADASGAGTARGALAGLGFSYSA